MSKHKKVKAWVVCDRDGKPQKMEWTRDDARKSKAWMERYAARRRLPLSVNKAEIRILPNRKAR